MTKRSCRWLQVWVGVVSLGCSGAAAAQVEAYDVTPLLASVRPEAQAAARRALGDLARLPMYDLRLDLSDDLRSFELHEDLRFENTEDAALGEIVLRVYANRGQSDPPVRFLEASCEGVSCVAGWDASGVLTLTLAQPLAVGARLVAHVHLRGELKEIAPQRTNMLAQAMEGMSRMQAGAPAGDYGLLAHGDGMASLTRFYAVLARRRGGAWIREEQSGLGDVAPDRVCHVRALIHTPPNVVIAASGSVTQDRTELAGTDGPPARHEVHIVAGLVRDFAVLASSNFRLATRQLGEVELRSVYLQGDEAAGERVLESAAHALRTFERRFGPYPYRRLDLVEAPLVGGAGGVEFSGLVTVASMFYRPLGGSGGGGDLGSLLGMIAGGNVAETMTGPMLEFVTAHEVSHQWWSGLVGSDSREHPFVDESLAQYSAALVMEERYGAARATQEMARQVAQNYQMMRMQGGTDGRVDRPAREFASEMQYAGLVYGKGPFFYPAARRVMGDRAFFRALRRYVRENAFRVTAPSDLRRAFARGPRRAAVRRLFARYFEQTHGDQDLGQAEQGAMLGQWLGASGNADAQTLLGGLLGQLQGGAGQGEPSAADIEALRAAARMLEQLGTATPAGP